MKWFWKKARTMALIMCAILVVNMNANIMPSFATVSEQVNVIFRGNGGQVTLTVNGESRTYPSCGEMFEAGSTIGATVSMGDPVWEGYTFAGWELGRMVSVSVGDQTVTEFNRMDDALYSTAEVLAFEVPSGYSELIFMAQWPDYDGSSGTPGDMGNATQVIFEGNGGNVTYTANNTQFSDENIWNHFTVGTQLGDSITSLSDPVFWDPTRPFAGWMACTYGPITTDGGNTFWGYTQVPGTSIMTSAEVLNYTVPESEVRIRAQWAGDDDDYYSNVFVNGYGHNITFTEFYWENDQKLSREISNGTFGNYLKETSEGFAIQCQDWIQYKADPVRDDATLEGWIEFRVTEENGNTTIQELISNTIYTTEQMLAKAVPEYDVMYVAKWSDIAVEDYFNNNGGNGGTDSGRIYISGNGGEVNYTYQSEDGEVYNNSSWLFNMGYGGVSTVGEGLSAGRFELIGGTKANYDFAGWTVYTCDNLRWEEAVAGTAVDFGSAFIVYQDQESYGGNVTYDRYLLADSYSISDSVLTTAQLCALSAEKSYFVKANWTRSADVNKPVFEGMEVTYDAAANKIIFEIEAYDADSTSWRYSICFKNNSGRQYYVYKNNVTENPCTIEYSADMIEDGTYYVSYVDIYDTAGNSLYNYFNSSQYTFEVTNSPYVCPVEIASVSSSKESVEVSKTKSEEVIITVELEKGKELLKKDEYNNNRIGYLNYNYSDEIDLYLDEQGNITGTYTVDWLAANAKEYVARVCLFIEETMPDGSTSDSWIQFRYDYEHELGAFQVNNTDNWQGELNAGPVQMTSFTVIDKSTGNALENGKFFDVANGASHKLEFSTTLVRDIPENAELRVAVEDSISNSVKWVILQKQEDGSYKGELVIDDRYQYTQYVMEALVVFRGYFGHHYQIAYELQPYFNVKNGSDFTVNSREVTIHVYKDSAGMNKVYQGTVRVDGRNNATLEELLGGEESYEALVTQTMRGDGVTCDAWVTGYWEGASLYEADDVVSINNYQTNIYFYPSYAYTDTVPVFCYYDAEGYAVYVPLDAIRTERGDSIRDLFDAAVTTGGVPTVPTVGGHAFIGWDVEVYEWEFSAENAGGRYNFWAEYDQESFCVDAKWIDENGEEKWENRVFFVEEDTTVSDLLTNMPAPRPVSGYTFRYWKILEGSEVYLGGEEVGGVWTPIYGPWQEDMLLVEYGCPPLEAVYERVGGSSNTPSATATPIPTATPVVTPAPTRRPVAEVVPVPATTPAATEEPAILTPPGVEMSEASVEETVQQLAELIANVDAMAETPSLVLDMTTETGEVATVVPVAVLEIIQGQNVDVVLDMGGYSWTINGNDIKAANLSAINLEVKVDAEAIPSKMVEALAGGAPARQLSLTHNGDFGFKASLSVNLGAENAGQFGNMYYYDSDGRLVFMNAGQIDEEGNVSLSFSHASDYVVIVGEEVVAEEGTIYVEANGTLASAKEEAPAEPEKKPEESVAPVVPEKSEEAPADAPVAENGVVATGSANVLPIILIVVIGVIVIVATAAVMLKKKEK